MLAYVLPTIAPWNNHSFCFFTFVWSFKNGYSKNHHVTLYKCWASAPFKLVIIFSIGCCYFKIELVAKHLSFHIINNTLLGFLPFGFQFYIYVSTCVLTFLLMIFSGCCKYSSFRSNSFVSPRNFKFHMLKSIDWRINLRYHWWVAVTGCNSLSFKK